MSDDQINILILCTGNSARSILGEAIVNRLGNGRVLGFSAGSQPKGEVNPGALRLLKRHEYPVEGLRSKNWDEFAGKTSAPIDIVITVCDNAAGEVCPIWPGHPAQAHWGLADPAAVEGDTATIDAAFEATHTELNNRIAKLIELLNSERNVPVTELRQKLKAIHDDQLKQEVSA